MTEYYSVTLDSETHLVSGKNNVPDEIAQYVFQRKWEHNEDKKLFSYFKGKGKDAVITDTEHPSHDQKHYGKNSFEYGNQRYYLTKMKWADSSFSVDFINEIKRVFGERFVIEQISKDKYDELKGYEKNSSKVASSHKKTDSTIPSSSTHVSQKIESNKEKEARDAKFRTEIEKTWKEGNLCFCTDNVVKEDGVDGVVDILTGLFPGMKNIFTERYQKMCANWYENWWRKKNFNIWKQAESDLDFVMPKEEIKLDKNGKPRKKTLFLDALLAVPNHHCRSKWNSEIFDKYNNIGHDMPTWLYYKKNADGIEYPMEGRPRVMIVSQDPLRKNHNGDKHLFLSTPWAFHSLSYIYTQDDTFSLMMELQIVHSYLNRGAIVYLTDYCKLYCSDNSEKQERVDILEKFKQSKVHFNSAIKKEIKRFNPDFIVSLGNQTAIALTGYWNEEKDHRNMCVPLLDELCPDSQNKISVYVRYHTGAHPNDNPHCNDPEYWYIDPSEEQGSSGDQNGFITSNDISKQGGEQ